MADGVINYAHLFILTQDFDPSRPFLKLGSNGQIGYAATLEGAADFNNILSPAADQVYVYLAPDKQGIFRFDPDDTTTPADDAITFVTAAGKRFKRIVDGLRYDARWFGKDTPWFDSIAEANGLILVGSRAQGVTVQVMGGGIIAEYWYAAGIADVDLVGKYGGGAASFAGISGMPSENAALAAYVNAREPKINWTAGTTKFLREDRTFADPPAGSGGGVSDGNKGDMTVTAGGATWALNANVVTFGKMQQLTGPGLLGKVGAGAGNIQPIEIGAGLALSAGTLYATGGGGGGGADNVELSIW